MEPEAVKEQGRLLREYATHFSMRYWDYTRETNIARVLYKNKVRYDRNGKRQYFDSSRLPYRIKHAVTRGLEDVLDKIAPVEGKPEDEYTRMVREVGAWRMFKSRLGVNSAPDGILDGGNVITYWEETGEYLQKVQPSVGKLVARFLEQEPENYWAQQIAEELAYIAVRYHDRLEGNDPDEGELV